MMDAILCFSPSLVLSHFFTMIIGQLYVNSKLLLSVCVFFLSNRSFVLLFSVSHFFSFFAFRYTTLLWAQISSDNVHSLFYCQNKKKQMKKRKTEKEEKTHIYYDEREGERILLFSRHLYPYLPLIISTHLRSRALINCMYTRKLPFAVMVHLLFVYIRCTCEFEEEKEIVRRM